MEGIDGERGCAGCERLSRRVAELEAQVERLSRLLEEAIRSGKRQAAPFSKGAPKDKPKKPGRKKGKQHGKHGRLHPPPDDQITETHQAPLPDACPDCDSKDIEHTGDVVQYQADLPREPIWRKFEIERGQCCGCRKFLQGRHPLQTSDAIEAAGVMLGAQAQAAIVMLNKTCGLSHGKVRRVFHELFHLPLSRGGSARVVLRVGRKYVPVYEQLCESVRGSPRVRADETGWRMGGRLGWLHALVGDEATCYLIRRSRGADVPAEVLGWEWKGTILHDGWAPYEQFAQADHAQCVQHARVRAKELLAVGRGAAQRLPRQVLDLFHEALDRQHQLQTTNQRAHSRQRRYWYQHFTDRLAGLVLTPKSGKTSHRRFAKHLAGHLIEWFVFLLDPKLEAANWQGEQAVRQAVVNRKVWGGSRTQRGARAQEVLMSILETCRRQALNSLDFLDKLLRHASSEILPHPP